MIHGFKLCNTALEICQHALLSVYQLGDIVADDLLASWRRWIKLFHYIALQVFDPWFLGTSSCPAWFG